MERIRKPYEGVWNVVRFNWHLYAILAGIILLSIIPVFLYGKIFPEWKVWIYVIMLAPIVVSMLASWYIYDVSDLYRLRWMDSLDITPHSQLVSINAGFDETSQLIVSKYATAELRVFDFYDPAKHTEVSVMRARKAYPPYPGTQAITTAHLPLPDNHADVVFALLAAHEIRDNEERAIFFRDLNRVLKPSGQIVVTEHLRDLPNLLAYNIGFFHFHSEATWKETFRNAGLTVSKQLKITPFITTFVLVKNGTAS